MTHPQYGKPETWPHRIPEPEDDTSRIFGADTITVHVEQRGRWSWFVVSKRGWLGWERGPYWRRSSAEKVRQRLLAEVSE